MFTRILSHSKSAFITMICARLWELLWLVCTSQQSSWCACRGRRPDLNPLGFLRLPCFPKHLFLALRWRSCRHFSRGCTSFSRQARIIRQVSMATSLTNKDHVYCRSNLETRFETQTSCHSFDFRRSQILGFCFPFGYETPGGESCG